MVAGAGDDASPRPNFDKSPAWLRRDWKITTRYDTVKAAGEGKKTVTSQVEERKNEVFGIIVRCLS